MAKLTRLRRLASVSAAGALLMSTVPATVGPAAASHTFIRDLESGCPSDRVPDYDFDDVASGATHEFTINCLVWYGFTLGTSETTYAPGVNTKRGQMAAFLFRMLEESGVALDRNAPTEFEDVEGTFFEEEINALSEIDVVFGEPDSDDYDGDGDTSELIYGPNVEMDRGLMAAFINNVHEAATGTRMTSTNDYFTDDNDNQFEDDINGLAEFGIVTGKTDTEYEPDSPVFRGAMGSFLARQADHLVDSGVLNTPVNGAADILLDEDEVKQGRSLTGSVYIDESDQVDTMFVDGCSLANQEVDVTSTNTFSVAIPFEQPVGDCQLVFDVTLVDSQTELETKTITVLQTDKFLTGPQLVSLSVQDTTSESVTLRFEFDESLNDVAVEASAFHIYTYDNRVFDATAATISGDNFVDAQFDAAGYQDATAGGLSRFAVQDLEGNFNAEYGFGLQSLTLDAGETGAPDLESVSGSGSTFTFTFDQPVFDAGTQPSDFHLVVTTAEGVVEIAGESFSNNTNGSTQRGVVFAVEGTPVSGYVDAGVLAAEDGGSGINASQSATLNGRTQPSPFLQSTIIDASSNLVQYVFSEAVGPGPTFEEDPQADMCVPEVSCATFPPEDRFFVYDIFGNEYQASAIADGPGQRAVTLTFPGDTPWGLVAGASVQKDGVSADRDAALTNPFGELGVSNSFAQGETAGPDFTGVSRSVSRDEEGNVTSVDFTLKFDQAFDHVTDGATTNIYIYDFEQTSLNIEGNCTIDAELNELICTVEGDSAAFAVTAVYLSVTSGVVNEAGDTADRPNYEAGFEIA